MKKYILIIVVVVVLIVPIKILAQGSVPNARDTGTVMPTDPSSATNLAPASAIIRTANPLPTPTLTAKPTYSPKSTTKPSPQVIQSVQPEPQSEQSQPTGNSITPVVLTGIILSVLGLTALSLKSKKIKQNKKQQNDDGRCNGIKELLEQKKKELQEAVQNWPQDKLKAITEVKAIEFLSKDEIAKEGIEKFQQVKAKYDKIKGMIEMLEKRYDLCMLSLPDKNASYQGTIIENSLNDKAILDNLKVMKTYPLEDWMLHDVQVNEKQIEKMGECLSDGPWYMHFWQKDSDDVTVVFKDKNFKIKYSDKNTWTEAINHGKSLGIPEEQLNFKME